MSSLDPNAIIRGAQLTLVGGTFGCVRSQFDRLLTTDASISRAAKP